MALNRKLWVAVLVVMALSLIGAFVISATAARNYLQQQLAVKNADNANALALSLTQQEKDPVTVELLLSAQFDAGHYRLIRLEAPEGHPVFERRNDAPVKGVPNLLITMLPINVPPGIAQVQDGWQQFGTLTLESHHQYAYAELWGSTLRLVVWFLVLAVAAGIVGTLLLQVILQPLKGIVDQAEAIGARRFIQLEEPSTTEFKQVVRTMNRLSEHVKEMLEVESQRVDQLRLTAQRDPVTGLQNRETFMALFESALMPQSDVSSGALAIVRISGLAELNQLIGRDAADQLLHRVGERIRGEAERQEEPWAVARLNAGDIVALVFGETDARTVAQTLLDDIHLVMDEDPAREAIGTFAGCTRFTSGESRSAVLARVDGALALSEQGQAPLMVADLPAATVVEVPPRLDAWREAIGEALRRHGVRLGRFPLVTPAGEVVHFESPVRLRLNNQWLPATHFIAWVSRLGLVARLDTLVVDAAMQRIREHNEPLSITVAAESICDGAFCDALATHLRANQAHAKLLWVDVAERSALQHQAAFRNFCARLKPLGCKVGLKQAGHQFARIAELHDVGIDYLKIDAAIIQGIPDNPAHQAFVRSLCMVAHTIGMTALAAGVDHNIDRDQLAMLGIDGVTGPAVRINET